MDEYRIWYEISVETKTLDIPYPRKLKIMVPFDGDILCTAIDRLRDEIFREEIGNIQADVWSSFSDLKEAFYKQSFGNIKKDIDDTSSIGELRLVMVPDYVVYNRYTIVGVKRIDGCEGCLIDAPGQRDHMECPNGCLHLRGACTHCLDDVDELAISSDEYDIYT